MEKRGRREDKGRRKGDKEIREWRGWMVIRKDKWMGRLRGKGGRGHVKERKKTGEEEGEER